MAKMVLGVFSEQDLASNAISRLEEKGYDPKEMSILMRDTSGKVTAQTGAGEVIGNTVGGAVAGGIIGGLAGLVAAFAIPGLGAIFIGGPLATALGLTGAAATTATGAATGALAGGIIGALTSAFGMSEEEARLYESSINEGGILVAVPARAGEEPEVEDVMSEFNADNIKTLDSQDSNTRSMSEKEATPAYMHEVKRVRRKG